MSRPFAPALISANDLVVGDVVYLTPEDSWSRTPAEAEFFEDEAHAQLRLLEALTDASVVGAAFAAAQMGPAGPEPVGLREVFRARGPSNRAHGKQETGKPEQGHV